MSTKSGITVSKEVIEKFKSLKNGGFIIKVGEDNTQLVPDTQFLAVGDNLEQNFQLINEYISKLFPDPAYIVISKSADEYIFISFIPDVAPIKQKMIYASTKNTLMLALGNEHFSKGNTFAWTGLEELTYESYKSESSNPNDGPLTADEKVLKQLNSLEDLTLSLSGFKKKLPSMHDHGPTNVSGSSSGNLLQKIDSELQLQFDELPNNAQSNQLLTFHIQDEVMTVASHKPNVKLGQLITEMDAENPDKIPQYAIYNYDNDRFCFLYSCPSGSKVKDRMIYASSKLALINHLNESLKPHNLKIDKSLEVGDLEELELSELDSSESNSAVNSDSSASRGLRFNKPKGPRRR